jgi:hypothetical protein
MTDTAMLRRMVGSLRHGIPPERGVILYSVGHEKLIEGVKTHHIDGIEEHGKIRFVSGSWGSGKTHLFRILREIALEQGCLVSNVELNVDEAPFNKFEMVFYSIVRNIQTPSHYFSGASGEVAPFGRVLEEALSSLGTGDPSRIGEITSEQYAVARTKLMARGTIDIDFKKIVDHFWKTFVAEGIRAGLPDQTRGELLQWFAGEGDLKTFRSRFSINKMVSRDLARVMLDSLAGFMRLAGYRGLVILFDEAEQSYSIMRKADRKVAHNNLLSLINNIEKSPGLFMIYATTRDFFDDPGYGIVQYQALASRVGTPRDSPPTALQNIWNLDAVRLSIDDYEAAAMKIRNIYADAYPEPALEYPGENDLKAFVREIANRQGQHEAVHFWRVMVANLIAQLDDRLEGQIRSPEAVYEDTMALLRE